jgi:hypothetical protein
MVHDWGSNFGFWHSKIPLTPFSRGKTTFPFEKLGVTKLPLEELGIAKIQMKNEPSQNSCLNPIIFVIVGELRS